MKTQLIDWTRTYLGAVGFSVALSLSAALAHAETLIVAIGASNTAGKGVSKKDAWPARLEDLLDAQGYDVRIVNAGVNGDDITRIIKRLESSIPRGTKIVILDKARFNSEKRGIDVADHMPTVKKWMKAHRVKLVVVSTLGKMAGGNRQPDGLHFTETGHDLIAKALVSDVAPLLQK